MVQAFCLGFECLVCSNKQTPYNEVNKAFWVWGLGFRVWGLGSRVWGLGIFWYRVWG